MRIKPFVLSEFEVNNYLLIEGKNAVLIDAGFKSEKIETYLIQNRIHLQAILLTHTHLDHIGGLESIRRRFNAPVYVHKKESRWLGDSQLNGSDAFPYFGQVICQPADIIIENDGLLDIGDFHFNLFYTPGHTPGGISYLINDWLFTGDTLFYRSIGRTDLYGGDQFQLLETIQKKIFSLPDDIAVFPGHGKETTIGDEKKLNPFL